MGSNNRKRLIRACEGLLKSKVKRVDFPGGESRKSCRMTLENGETIIATERPNRKRAILEARVMRSLSSEKAPVPRVVGFNGMILFQEDLEGERLSAAIHQAADGDEIEAILDQAVSSLAEIQRGAKAANLSENIPVIGKDEAWLEGLIRLPSKIGEDIGLPAPELDVDALLDILAITEPRLVKWDSRPGNAVVGPDKKVYWFDWEHCGLRNPLDDLGWLLCDEFVPSRPEAEERIIDRYITAFSDADDVSAAKQYLSVFGSFHSCVRLELIIDNKGDEDWWDWKYCIDEDKVGINLRGARRVCRRGARWAEKHPKTEPLSDWFEDVYQEMKTW